MGPAIVIVLLLRAGSAWVPAVQIVFSPGAYLQALAECRAQADVAAQLGLQAVCVEERGA